MTYIIAELGSVADGSYGNTICLIDECYRAGVDAVKLQCHEGERIKGDPPWFKGHEQRGDYLKRTGFRRDQWHSIRTYTRELGVDLIVSPFSVEAVALLEELPVDAYKVASGQVTNLPMLEAIGKTGRRVYISNGMSDASENLAAWYALRKFSEAKKGPILLQCTSEYPCQPERVGLNKMAEFRKERAEFGLSDHTLGFAASLAAITLGASVIERHVTFHRGMYGTDACNSLTLEEFGRFVKEVRDLDLMLANQVDKDALVATPAMSAMREAFLER